MRYAVAALFGFFLFVFGNGIDQRNEIIRLNDRVEQIQVDGSWRKHDCVGLQRQVDDLWAEKESLKAVLREMDKRLEKFDGQKQRRTIVLPPALPALALDELERIPPQNLPTGRE